MKLLLDTHIWLWSAIEPQRLSKRVGKELAAEENELWVSPISAWELSFLHRKRRIKMPQPVAAWVTSSMEVLKLTEAPLTIDVALAVSSLEFPHGDPADHFIAATARVFDLVLVTSDQNLIDLAGIRVLANR